MLTKCFEYTIVTHNLRGGRVLRWCWVNFQCWGVLLIWIIVGQGPTAPTVGAGGGCFDIFSLSYHFSLHSPSLWEAARYTLKYCLKGPLSPKHSTNNSQSDDDCYCYFFPLNRKLDLVRPEACYAENEHNIGANNMTISKLGSKLTFCSSLYRRLCNESINLSQ